MMKAISSLALGLLFVSLADSSCGKADVSAASVIASETYAVGQAQLKS